MARPSEFTQQTADAICERLADGESLRSICESEEMPNRATVFRWLSKFPEFSDQYARAREAQAEALADEILQISDEGQNDWMEKYNQKGEAVGWQVNGEAVLRSKLRVDTRKWIASKLRPKKYGEKVDLEHSGPDGGPIVTKIVREIVRPKNSNG